MSKIPINDITPDPLPSRRQPSSNGKRIGKKIYVREIKGRFQQLRLIGGSLLFALYFFTLWFNWGERQAVLFDLPSRQFHIFAATFWPQDLVLLSFLLIILAFILFAVTTFAGRIWCGYACPQTIWTYLFMWLEERIEGPRNKRIKLDQRQWDADKLLRKGLKHSLWLLIALLTGITFVGYFYPVRELVPDLLTLSASPWAMFWVAFFTLATYGNAGWLRELVCLHMCPYARFQSVMFDRNTLIVSYDQGRGEGEKGRGPRKKKFDHRAAGLGDCIDCDQCVQVCPTGIDIRDGLQYQCVACGLCVDACNQVMTKMDYPRNLISYTTESNLQGKRTKFIRPRLVGYTCAVLVMLVAFGYTLLNRSQLELDILRDRSALYTYSSEGLLQNSYTLKLTNKLPQTQGYQLSVTGLSGITLVGQSRLLLQPGEIRALPISVTVPTESLSTPNATITFYIHPEDPSFKTISQESRFIGPRPGTQ